MLSYQYRKSHCGNKIMVKSSYLHNGNSYTDKTESLYWISHPGFCNDLMHSNSNQLPEPMFNTLRLRQNGRHFSDDICKCIFLNENVWISIEVPLTFVPKGPINNIPALVQIMAWRGPGDKPLSEPMMIILLMHICVTRPRWVNKVQMASPGIPFTNMV